MATNIKPSHGRFDDADETREFEHGRAEVLRLGDSTLSRFTFEPGWRWSDHVRPIAGTESCQVHHVGYVARGRLGTRMDDGTEFEAGPGEAVVIPPGHDGWVIGDETLEFVEFSGGEQYAKR